MPGKHQSRMRGPLPIGTGGETVCKKDNIIKICHSEPLTTAGSYSGAGFSAGFVMVPPPHINFAPLFNTCMSI